MKNIVLASNNAGKLAEIRALLSHLPVNLIPQTEFIDESVAETGLSFVENALIKARHASKISGYASIADDSGLVVDALNGDPGIYSARYAGDSATDSDNINKLLADLEVIHAEKAKAYFYCALVYLQHSEDPTPIICQARWKGYILPHAQGDAGFGYDPIFYVPSHQCSAAQLPATEKNKISHRGQALQQFLEKFNFR